MLNISLCLLAIDTSSKNCLVCLPICYSDDLLFWCLMFWHLCICCILIHYLINSCKHFLPFCGLSFHSGNCFIWYEEVFLNCMQFHCLIFWALISIQKLIIYSYILRVFPMISCKSFKVSGLQFPWWIQKYSQTEINSVLKISHIMIKLVSFQESRNGLTYANQLSKTAHKQNKGQISHDHLNR
jgi:hypothetical protein